VFILVPCNTSLGKNCVARSYVRHCSLCDRMNLRKKLVCLRSLAVSAYEISRRTRIFSTNSRSSTKRLKHSSNFQYGENAWSSNVVEFEFELRHIPNRRLNSFTAIVPIKLLICTVALAIFGVRTQKNVANFDLAWASKNHCSECKIAIVFLWTFHFRSLQSTRGYIDRFYAWELEWKFLIPASFATLIACKVCLLKNMTN